MDCDAHAKFRVVWRILSSKVVHSDLGFGKRSGSLVGLRMQDYKSLFAAVTICSTLFNIRTHTQTTFDQLIWKAQPAEN